MVPLFFLLGAGFLSLSLAANDFTTPCRGSCSYESGDGMTTAWNSIVLDGAPEAISDISEAAGWNVLTCNATSTEAQVIRLVCTKPENGCDDLFLGGAEHTIVRLPDDCAGAPFARVISIEDDTDQNVPDSVTAKLSKRGTPPKVLSLAFDYDFGKLPASRGEVTFTTVATTNPLQRPFTQVSRLHAALKRSTGMPSFLSKRDLFNDFVNSNKITSDLPQVNNSTPTPDSVVRKWDKGDTHSFNLLDVHQNFLIFDGSISCPVPGSGLGASVNAHLDTDLDVSVTLTVGYIISGTIFPPSITRAAFTTALEGNTQAVFNVRAEAIGTFDTGLLPLYNVGLPGLDIPGIISVGPSFAINGQAQVSLGVATQAKITAAYKLANLQFVFPQDQGGSSAAADNAAPAQPLSLSVGGSASLTGKVEAHIIPRVEFGVSLLFGAAKASIFLEVDGYSVLDMSLSGSATASTSIPVLIAATATSTSASGQTTNTSTSVSTSTSNGTSTGTSTGTTSNTYDGTISTSTAETATNTNTNTSTTANTDTPTDPDTANAQLGQNLYKPAPVSEAHAKRDGPSFSYQGCIGLDMGISVNGGVQGKLLDTWSSSINIYSQKWDIFEKCFGVPSARRRSEPKLHAERFNLRSNQLTCPSIVNLVSLI